MDVVLLKAERGVARAERFDFDDEQHARAGERRGGGVLRDGEEKQAFRRQAARAIGGVVGRLAPSPPLPRSVIAPVLR